MNSAAVSDLWNQFILFCGDWGARLLAAAVIAVIAYAIARAVKWGLAAAIDRLPIARKPKTEGEGASEPTIGERLGDAGFWLVLLFALPQALHALKLDAIVAPLDAMIARVFAFLPNLFGAVLIFAIGALAANIARRATVATLDASNADRWIAKAGAGVGGVTQAAGHIVYALVIIPVAIAALEALRIEAISMPAIEVLRSVLDAAPRLFAAAILFAITFAVGRFVGGLVEQTLPSLGFDRAVAATGLGDAPGGMTPSKLAGAAAMIAISLFGAIEAAGLLHFAAVSSMLAAMLELAGKVAFGAAIILAGVLLARAVGAAVSRAAGDKAGFAAAIARGATVALSTAMGLRFMGLAPEIVTLAFGLILGSIAIAAALAFGLGGRAGAGRLVDEWVDRKALPPPPSAKQVPAAE